MDRPTFVRDVGARLLVAIQAVDGTPASIARQFGVKLPRMDHWIRGRHPPDPLFVAMFCLRFNVSADFIYLGRFSGASALEDRMWQAVRASGPSRPAPDRRRPGRPRRETADGT